jgi:hypothetical protein
MVRAAIFLLSDIRLDLDAPPRLNGLLILSRSITGTSITSLFPIKNRQSAVSQ